METSADLDVAFLVAERAAGLALTYFERGVTSTPKEDGSPVTEADREVEGLLRSLLAELRPGDSLLGEEYGRVGDSERLWILDPIDGTSFFGRRDPHWRIHLALEIAGTLELAVVTSPALGLQWWATRGGGAFESVWPRTGSSPQRLTVSTTSSLKGARVEALGALPPGPFPTPSTPLPLVELVRGETDAVLAEGFAIWDHAPWVLLVQEAGGRFTDPAGGRSPDHGGLYSNAVLHEELLVVVGYPRPG